jgi:predicted N-acetyltransferase YhbS
MFEIRLATEDDAQGIQSITKKAFQIYRENVKTANAYFSALTESVEDIKKDITHKTVFIAVREGEIVGSIRVEFLTPELAYISRFAVNPDEHNQGVGAGILQKALDECTENGIIKAALHTNSKYYKLARYYYGKGFYVHSTTFDRGYIRALFIKDIVDNRETDLEPAFRK